jgi:hypothetical protein
MTPSYLRTPDDLRVHEHLRQEAEAMVRLLLGSRVEDVPAVGFCWPSEELTLRGERLSKLVISLPAEPKRADLWKKVVVKYAPFALLQVAPSPDEIVATFETVYGAACWRLRGDTHLTTITPTSGALGLLWRAGGGH